MFILLLYDNIFTFKSGDAQEGRALTEGKPVRSNFEGEEYHMVRITFATGNLKLLMLFHNHPT